MLRFVQAIGAFVVCFLTPTLAQSFEQGFYYKLSTQFRGDGMKLDVFNGGPKNNLTRLEPDQDVSGQYWRFIGNGDGTFRLSTLFRGPNMCLDIFNGGPNNNQPHLIKCGNFSGQLWNVLVAQDSDFVRLTTKFRGPGLCLDIFNGGQNNNQPHLTKCDNFAGQLWMLTKTDKQVAEAATRNNSTGQFAYTRRAIKEIELTDKQIQAVLSIEKELRELFPGDQGRSAPLDNPERAEALAKVVIEKYGLRPDEYEDVIMNINLILSGIDQQTKKFIGPPEQIEQEIGAVKADKSVQEAERREHLAQLEAALSDAKPIQFKENIALVLKSFDKLPPFTDFDKRTWCALQLRYLNCKCLMRQVNNPDVGCTASSP